MEGESDKKSEAPAADKPVRHTVPPMETGADGRATARGIAKHAADLLAAQWQKELRAFRDPTTCILALFNYARLTAARLADAEDTIDRLELRLAAIESWRAGTEQQAKLAQAVMEGKVDPANLPPEMLDLLPQEMREALLEMANHARAKALPPPPVLVLPPDAPSDGPTPIAEAKAKKKGDVTAPQKGGAA